MWQTIKNYGNALQNAETYIFPFLTDDLNPIQADDRIETIIYQINRWMTVIFEELNINERSSTLLTRYSIANHLKQLGASTEIIKDMLGHASVKTIEINLNCFDVDVHGDYVRQLMDKHNAHNENNAITDIEVIEDAKG